MAISLDEGTESKRSGRERAESLIEVILFGGRWLLAPLYLGLIAGLLVLVLKFAEALWHMLAEAPGSSLQETTLGILEILDIALLGNLIIIVVFSGYENFVSKINVAKSSVDRPTWMGKVDFSGLKIKLIGSLVAISVIELLKDFLSPETIDPEQELWLIIIHLTFVVSGVLFAVTDYIADKRASIDIAAQRAELELRILERDKGFAAGTASEMNPMGE
jgi:uncharacterized protein (TIGR00645 family)